MRMLMLSALLLISATGEVLAAKAGTVTLLTGRGTASTLDGAIRALRKGDTVNSGEVINSGANSYVNLKFKDGSFILLRPNSRFQVEEFEYDGEDLSNTKGAVPPKDSAASTPESGRETSRRSQASTTGRAFFRLLKGGFRAVTGLVGRADRNQYRVATPVATIGIRGTDYVVVLVDPAIAADPVLAASLPGGIGAEGGVVVGVINGGVFVQNSVGQTADIGTDQYLVTLPDGTQVELPYQPRFLRVDPIPNPESCE